MSDYKYIIYFRKYNSFVILFPNTMKIETLTMLPQNINKYEIFGVKIIDDIETSLREYNEKFIKWATEIKESNILRMKIDFFEPYYGDKKDKYIYRTNSSMIEMVFNVLCKNKLGSLKVIPRKEALYFENCYNSGLMYCKPGLYEECFGYDCKMYYPSILSNKNFYFPIKEGKEIKLTNLPDKINKLKYGIYKAVVKCDHDDFKKLFAFSKDNYYTHFDLAIAIQNKKKFGVNIALVQNCDYNAYVYKKKNLVSGYDIFSFWYSKMKEFKNKFPGNTLIKMLSSRLWGHLTKFNIILKTEEEINNENLVIGISYNNDYKIKNTVYNDDEDMTVKYHTLIDCNAMYRYNLRLKPFLTSYARCNLYEYVIQDISNVIRIQTDGIVYKTKQNFKCDNIVMENKTSGTIRFENVNVYYKKCDICGEFVKSSKKDSHYKEHN